MKTHTNYLWSLAGLLGVLCAPAYATVAITAMTPSVKSPQLLGTPVTWTVTATDSNPNLLTFQFNVAVPGQALGLIKDFNVGTLAAGTWTAQPFVWVPTGVEGAYKVEVVIKDFTSGETATKTVVFDVTPRVTGATPVITATANPIVALFSAPSCASGSTMAVRFQPQTKSVAPAVTTLFQKCHPPATMNFEIAGMYPSTEYEMVAETKTDGKITASSTVAFKTGALPTNITFPSFTVDLSTTPDTTDWVILQNLLQFGVTPIYPAVATDLTGKIIWYYNPGQSIFLTRPLQNGTFLTMQSGPSWDPASTQLQLLDQIDFAGNIVKETNIGVLSEQLLAMGATDATLCSTVLSQTPTPPSGAACIDSFHHDAIQTLPNGDTAVLVAIEKIFPAGTQGSTTGLPVDIIGDMIIVLNSSWQVVWYFDTFDHDGGAEIPITQPAVLGETCSAGLSGGCPEIFLVTSGISPKANDWLHANALYYWPQDKDIIMSMRNQDLVVKIDYNNGVQSGGLGTGNVLWRMGPCWDFTMNSSATWPWFSHQHDVGIQNNGAGPLSVLDNGNTRWSQPGKSTGCIQGLGSGDSRGMALTVDETSMTVSPLLSANLGFYSPANGASGMLSNGNYFFLNPVVLLNLETNVSYSVEILPAAGSENGTQVYNIQGPEAYRAWRMPSLYQPPTI